MISGVGSAAILVNDAKKSVEWYRDKLGFEVVGNEGHAVFVRPKGSEFPLLHLCGKCEDWGDDQPGGRTGVWLNCGEIALHRKDTGSVFPASDPANVEKTYRELKEKGVEFSMDLTTTSWGKMAILKDPDGNEFEISTEIS
jgi:catechol 2,3-dioxygenase-like lactoylglutathione lyase family enzyme